MIKKPIDTHTCTSDHEKIRKSLNILTVIRKSKNYCFLQAIVESPTGQLKLGEIYTWFSNNFKHFRTTCNLTWKVTKNISFSTMITDDMR